MKQIIRGVDVYVADLRSTLEKPLDVEIINFTYSELNASDAIPARRLIQSLLLLIPMLAALASNKAYAKGDRLIATLALYSMSDKSGFPKNPVPFLLKFFDHFESALIVHLVTSQMVAPSKEIACLITMAQDDVSSFMMRLPESVTKSLNQFIADMKETVAAEQAGIPLPSKPAEIDLREIVCFR